jgi:hypothetical protein
MEQKFVQYPVILKIEHTDEMTEMNSLRIMRSFYVPYAKIA